MDNTFGLFGLRLADLSVNGFFGQDRGRSPLLPVTRDTFSAVLSAQAGYLFTENIFFERDEAGRVTGFRVCTSGIKNMPFARIGQDPI